MRPNSRFATVEAIFTEEFSLLNKKLAELQAKYKRQDHKELNLQRFNWADKITYFPMYYVARMWEFPFAIIETELKNGMKGTDVGCGNTPFIALLAEKVGVQNVTDFDPDFIADDTLEANLHFGALNGYIKELGTNFHNDGMTKMTAPDNYFDRVFCICVLEHAEDIEIRQKGLKEMARILKPDGRLILIFDLGIQIQLNDILQTIQFTGLIPYKNISLRWTKKRFVNYGNNSNVDVFGLVLEKPDDPVYSDQRETESIPIYKTNALFSRIAEHYAVSYTDILVAKDLNRNFNPFCVFIKGLLGKY